MRIEIRTVLITSTLSVLLATTGLLALQYRKHRADATTSQYYKVQYSRSITSLHEAVNAIEYRFSGDKPTWTTIEVNISANPATLSKETPATSPLLQGIAWNLRRPLVMLNNTVYTTGDSFNGYLIEKILPDRIIVRNRLGAKKQIKLREDSL